MSALIARVFSQLRVLKRKYKKHLLSPEIFARPAWIRKIRKNVDLATITRYTVYSHKEYEF